LAGYNPGLKSGATIPDMSDGIHCLYSRLKKKIGYSLLAVYEEAFAEPRQNYFFGFVRSIPPFYLRLAEEKISW